MKRGLEEEEIVPSRAWNYKDVIVKCISKFLSLREKSMLSQTCRKLYVMFVKHDESIRLMCGLWRLDDMNTYAERACITTSGNLECVRFLLEYDTSFKEPEIFLKIIYKSSIFQHENVISYLTNLLSLQKFKIFKKLIKRSFERDDIAFCCSLFTNENSKWFEKNRFDKFKLKFKDNFRDLKEKIWFRSVSGDGLETIKKYENTFKCEDNISSSLFNEDFNVFNYFWNQLPLYERKGEAILNFLGLDLGCKESDQIIHVCKCILKDNPEANLHILLHHVELKKKILIVKELKSFIYSSSVSVSIALFISSFSFSKHSILYSNCRITSSAAKSLKMQNS